MSEYDGPERRRGYEELAEELDKHVAEIERRFQKWFRAGLIIITVIGLSSAVALFGMGYAIREVQQQRREVCENQNTRHDNAVKQFRREAAILLKRNPERARAIRINIEANLRILDALIPVQDCDKTVEQPLK
jgi:DNA-binding Lrp family transcriptional regulator